MHFYPRKGWTWRTDPGQDGQVGAPLGASVDASKPAKARQRRQAASPPRETRLNLASGFSGPLTQYHRFAE